MKIVYGIAKGVAALLVFALVVFLALAGLRAAGILPASLFPPVGGVTEPVRQKNAEAVQSVAPDKPAQASTPVSSEPVSSVPVAEKLFIEPVKAGVYKYLAQRSDYNALPNDACRSLYDAMAAAVLEVSETAGAEGLYAVAPAISKTILEPAEIRQTVMAFRNDNPQYFWVANNYAYSFRVNSTVAELYSYLPAKDCKAAAQELNAEVAAALNALPNGLSEQDREKAMFDTVTRKSSYDTAAVQNGGDWQAYTAYGALVRGKAVCEGYSRAMQLLCSYANIESRLISGKLEKASHMWNLVSVDGAWYHLDVTSCDSGNVLSYGYYNLTDAALKETHGISPSVLTLEKSELEAPNGADFNFPLPECTATAANYFVSRGVHVKGLDAQNGAETLEGIAQAILRGDSEIALYIAPNIDFTDTVEKLFQKPPYQMQEYISQVNKRGGKQVDYGGISYITAKPTRGITLHMKYK